ncbi:MAG: Re/Si-specific NAD(P)(+) transhydrogenase subunit alpha [Verrucomicrobiae bacterium]|nr:Re/Si-specific NAD(P)(+) transhydrogenase subunit alpha [Verrucomicrobiae bacterium]MCX7722454.1 Re/Si-specific NAD(P)(+) transhydrogenase subunit alpha [Verrucomicrobiae bacterium]MDW7980979.1 Re/Si-specific NAD(P)(+) transhydrogenase subunit alpha [Verrucomicrobiales bacterium]
MKICVPKETHPGETRAALIPDHVARLIKRGAQVEVESGLGTGSGYSDSVYAAAGATVVSDRRALLAGADMVIRLRKPAVEEIGLLKRGCIHVSYLDPFNEPELVRRLAAQGVSAISLEMIPRITRAQKMDVLSSQANLAGYVAVVLAASHCWKIFPMMMTAGGTIVPAKVFVIGAGVAGLQAIATARRLGAKVSAFDTRPVVEEQVKSLGATFVKIDLGETGQTKDGYAKPLTEEQLAKQRAALKKVCAESDVVITAAQVFGRKAPIVVTSEMLAAMRPGSVVVDCAIESGGNVEGAPYDKIEVRNGVTIIALANLPGRVPVHASQVLSSNMTALIEEFWDKTASGFVLKLDDEIIKGCLITHNGEVWHPDIKSRLSAA